MLPSPSADQILERLSTIQAGWDENTRRERREAAEARRALLFAKLFEGLSKIDDDKPAVAAMSS